MLKQLRAVLQSEWLVPAIFLFAMCGRFFNFINASLLVVVGLVVLILFVCEDVKNVIAIVMYAPFYINNVFSDDRALLFTIAVFTAVIGLLVAVALRIVKNAKSNLLKKGNFYIALAASSVAYLLGGIISNFSFERFLAVLMFCSASFFFYFLAINNTKNLVRFMYKTFVWGAIMVAVEMFASNVKNGGWENLFVLYSYSVGAENINVAALFMLLGICGLFGLGYKTRYDGTCFMLAIVFTIAIVVSGCRMIIFLSLVTDVALAAICFSNSTNKKNFAISLGVLFVVLTLLFIVFDQAVVSMIERLSSKGGLSGRDRLWEWCVNTFMEYPVFGVGFVVDEGIPGLHGEAARYVLAHNTVVQWLCSLGIVGTILMLYYTLKKYQILIKNLDVEFIIRFTMVMIAVSGVVDQAAQMDPFILNITIVLVAALENLTRNQDKEIYIKNYGYERVMEEYGFGRAYKS